LNDPRSGKRKCRVALVGLRFGAAFVPIYRAHPDVELVAICDSNPQVLADIGDRFQVERRFDDLDQVLKSEDYDAVHLLTPIPLHARQSVAVLEAAKHCACTVPMATSIEDLSAIIAAQRRAHKNYMMMETAVYTRAFLFVEEMIGKGELGRIQFLRGAHYQDMEHWPPYWRGLPPMHYATHAVSPLLALARSRATVVHCFGSGQMREELRAACGNPYPVEVAIFQIEGREIAAEATRSLFQTARAYTESFTVYGEKATFEWQQIEEEQPVVFRMEQLPPGERRPVTASRIAVPDRQDLLPPQIAPFTQKHLVPGPGPEHPSILQGGGHGGSHPHLVHEFVRSIVEDRKPRIDAVTAADWTSVGICAHESAMTGGGRVLVPRFD